MKTRLATWLLLLSSAPAVAQPTAVEPSPQPAPEVAPPMAAPPASEPPPTAVPPGATVPEPAVAPPAPRPYRTERGYVPPPPPRYVTPLPQPAPGARGGVPLIQPAPPPPAYVSPRPLPRPRPLPPREPRVYGNAGAPVALGLGGVLLWRDEAHRRFGSDDPNGGVELFASYDVWAPARWLIVAGGLDFRHDQRARSALGELKDNLLVADLTARARAASWLWPQLRAGVGLAVTHIGLNDAAASIKLDDRDLGAAGTFAAGVVLRTPARAFETQRGKVASLSLGVLFEGGYTLAQDASLSPEPVRGGDVRRTSPAAFQAQRSAGFLRIMAVTRF